MHEYGVFMYLLGKPQEPTWTKRTGGVLDVKTYILVFRQGVKKRVNCLFTSSENNLPHELITYVHTYLVREYIVYTTTAAGRAEDSR